MTKKNKKQSEPLVFLGYRIVDAEGNVLGTDPSQFPDLVKRCAEVAATIATGKHYRVVEEE